MKMGGGDGDDDDDEDDGDDDDDDDGGSNGDADGDGDGDDDDDEDGGDGDDGDDDGGNGDDDWVMVMMIVIVMMMMMMVMTIMMMMRDDGDDDEDGDVLVSGRFPKMLPVATKRTINPFRTAVPFWGQTSQISSSLSPKRDCGSKGVNITKTYLRDGENKQVRNRAHGGVIPIRQGNGTNELWYTIPYR